MTEFGPEERLSILVHGGSKLGKSTLTGTAPKPVLVLDAEGSWRFIPVRKVYWDPTQGGPPECDGTWDACIVSVREWGTVTLVYQWLSQYVTCFTSVVIDSITELQRRCKHNLKGSEAMKIADWGTLLSQMDGTIRGFRDLTLIPQLNVRCVVFVAETCHCPTGSTFVGTSTQTGNSTRTGSLRRRSGVSGSPLTSSMRRVSGSRVCSVDASPCVSRRPVSRVTTLLTG
jgi:hypothetical protein